LTSPTHSEPAKDSPENKLFDASVALAEAADREIGKAMTAAWTAGESAADPATTPEAEAVVKLIDKYVCHPDSESWWQPIVRAEGAKAGGGAGP
jgi:hypothetical protein